MEARILEQRSTVENFLDLYLIRNQSWVKYIASIFCGIVLLGLLAKIAIPLPFTPVPITGQTFGVILISLIYGRNKGFLTVGGYLTIGSLGLPVFAVAGGVTVGYLIGMAVASLLIGHLADRGWAASFGRSILAGTLGTAVIFASGLSVLAYFMPVNQIWMAGLIPFLPGAVLKILMASAIASGLHSRQGR